ncbi:MAG: hypothetical protein ACLFP2_01685 [Candidatus Woesearchaeota archaeon]
MKAKHEKYVAVFLIVVALLDFLNVFSFIGIALSHKFFDIVFILIGLYMIIKK